MTGWVPALRAAAHVPPWLWQPAGKAVAALVARRPPRPVRQWQANAEVVLGGRPDRALTRAAVESWVRNTMVQAQLHTWGDDELRRRVHVEPDALAALQHSFRTRGALVALPHTGCWDLAGAWANAMGMPVSTVAEQVDEFDHYVEARRRLGMRVYGQQERSTARHLLADLREGRLVCLVADRDLAGTGQDVAWTTATGDRRVTMPQGPARIARRTGADLFCCATRFECRDGELGIVLDLTGPLPGGTPGHQTQHLADLFSAAVLRHPAEWHVLVPFFDGVVAR